MKGQSNHNTNFSSGRTKGTLLIAQSGRSLLDQSVGSFRQKLSEFVASGQDREFLPAHLEILETPPPPLAVAFTWTMCAIFASVLIWSLVAHIDIYATASGRVQLSGRSKVIQPFETSKVKSILVQNGNLVKEGQILIDLDSTEAKSELIESESDLQAYIAQVDRRRATVEALKTGKRNIIPDFPKQVSIPIQLREVAAMSAVLKKFDSSIESLKAQISEKKATEKRYSESIVARGVLRDVLDERAKMRETLVTRGAGTRASVIDALQQVDQTSADIAMDRGQMLEAQASIVSLDRKIDQALTEQVSNELQSVSDLSQKVDTAFQNALRAKDRLDRLHLRSPIDGYVQQLAVTTQGQVVSGGQPLAVIVPSDGPIEIEAQISNQDIGFVRAGQNATIKVDAFPFIRYGTLDGTVLSVSHDSIDSREAMGSTDALSIAQGRGIEQGLGTAKTQDLLFPAFISIERNRILVGGRPVPLKPGMTVTVDLHTGRRSVIDYLLSPIREAVTTAGHER